VSGVSTGIPVGDLSPSLAFGAAYFSVSSIGTRLTNVREIYNEDGYTGTASFSCPIPNSERRLQVSIKVGPDSPQIILEVAGAEDSKLPGYLEEISNRIAETISKFGKAPGDKLAQASKAILVERKLDEALSQLLGGADYQKVYVAVADARERLIRLLGGFDPTTLQMADTLTSLAGHTGPIPKDKHEELALRLLRWKKRIKHVVETIIK